MFYVVNENGENYPLAYKTYQEAVAAVIQKHKEYLEEMEKDLGDCPSCNELDVPENTSGKMNLYIEKGIYICIYRFAAPQ